ncbi:MAG: hypothetical protein AAGA54_13760 [Myxococcota bacterium]
MSEPSTTLRVHLDTLEYTREGLRTRGPIDLATGRHNRVVLVRPTVASVPLTAHHGFATDRAFPLPATLSLLWSYRPTTSPLPPAEVPPGAKGTLQVFGHADANGDEVHNKTLSERRAAVVLALLQTDVEALLELASEDGWTAWEYQVLLRVLGSDPGPTDGDPRALTDRALAHFANRYRAGHFHSNTSPRVPGLEAKAFDAATVEALLDAFVHAHAPDLSGCNVHAVRPAVGCSEYNLLGPHGSQNRRVSLLTSLDDPHPKNAPCTTGDPGACAIVGEGLYGCMWYREHVGIEPQQPAALFDPRWLAHEDGSYWLSVLTNLPDDAQVTFDVFEHETPMSTNSPAPDVGTRLDERLSAPSIGGVATVLWIPESPALLDPQRGRLPVFRAATEDATAHTWANQADVVGVQLLDSSGHCYSEVSVSLETSTGIHPLTTDAQGIAWRREPCDGPCSVHLPDDLRLPHPTQTVTLKQPPTVADLEVDRGANVELSAGRVTRLRILPPEAASGYVSCHFDQGSTYPADTLVALVQHARDALETDPDARLALFGHTRVSGIPDVDKDLSDRRARFVHAVLTADLPALESVVEDDAWEDTHYISLAHFLGYEADDPRSLFASFQWGYSAGTHHDPGLDIGHGDIDATGDLDTPTRRALLDAFLATVGASIPASAFASAPHAGCGSFNPPPEGDHADRITLVVFASGRVPGSFPCKEGNAAACHIEASGRCRFFRERVTETSLRYRWLEGEPHDDEDMLHMGARVLVHQGARVAGAVYQAPPRIEDIVYAYAPPPSQATAAPLDVVPRVHFTSPDDELRGNFSKERKLRSEMVPDGRHLKPMAWAKTDTRTIEEVFLDFWVRAFEVLSQAGCKPTRDLLRPLYAALRANDPVTVPADAAFDPVRSLTDADFRVLALESGMVAAGQALNPFESERYAAAEGGGRYACNIYSTDLVALLPQGGWLPKVFFTHPKRVRDGKLAPEDAPLFPVGPSEINAFLNGKRGMQPGTHGWFRIPGDPAVRSGRRSIRKEAQKLANQGVLVVMSSGNKGGLIGHVAVVMPDLNRLSQAEKASLEHTTDTTYNEVHTWGYDRDVYPPDHHRPVRSQAGAYNVHGMHGGSLVMEPEQKYETPGYFRYDPSKDLGRGTDLERPTKKRP